MPATKMHSLNTSGDNNNNNNNIMRLLIQHETRSFIAN